ncbi:hypothetical protein A3726_06045 [Erythrobacter sp. HI0037]|nr:hypothetical protein A3727_09530 [Erythrobacter sp. HI0038]KZY22105.1 hypothetical protein A3726_06045 [Erythrobacter sp. HI0037]
MQREDRRMSGTSRPWLLTSPGRWVALYFFSVVIIAALKLTGAIESPVGFILLAAATCLLLPLARRRSDGCISRAMVDYNRRIVFSSLGYVLGLGIAVTLWNSYQLSDALVFAISLLPTVPTFGIIWAMARYLAEEQDEYLRHRMIMAALVALGVVLAIGIFYGFLEMFELVPHIWAWWVLPVWAIGLGLAQLWQKVRGS